MKSLFLKSSLLLDFVFECDLITPTDLRTKHTHPHEALEVLEIEQAQQQQQQQN